MTRVLLEACGVRLTEKTDGRLGLSPIVEQGRDFDVGYALMRAAAEQSRALEELAEAVTELRTTDFMDYQDGGDRLAACLDRVDAALARARELRGKEGG